MDVRQERSILLAANSSWNLVNFRAPIIAALKSRGYRLLAAVPADESASLLTKMGVEVHYVSVDSRGLSPFRDARLLFAYLTILRQLRPAVFFPFTAKPNIYGSIAAASLGIPVVNTITGLGDGFLRGRALEGILSRLYRWSLRRSTRVFFHNGDDRDLFVSRKIVAPEQASVVPGSGVDLMRFEPGDHRPSDGPLTFLFIGRLLKTKGAVEFVDAASMLGKTRPVRFRMLGRVEGPPDAIPRQALDPLVADGTIELVGEVADVRPFIAEADCVVLPSYREGLPRALLEASAMARPVIATDVPGCRQAVDHGVTGLLCRPRSAKSLAQTMAEIADMSFDERTAMGARGRRKVEREFSEKSVVAAYLDSLREVGL